MYIWFKFAHMLATLKKREPLDVFTGKSVLHYRTGISDLDFNMHMNNGRYLTLLDMGRVDFGLRTGLDRVVKERPWIPMVGALTTSFRSELRWRDRFRVESRLLSWDERWVYLEHRIYATSGKNAGKLSISTVVMACLYDRQKKKSVPTREVFEALGHAWREPEVMPEHLRTMAATSKLISSEPGAAPGVPA